MKIFELVLLTWCSLIASARAQSGILYPQESESREVKSLDGIWNFRLAPRFLPDLGFQERWYDQPLDKTGEVDIMPVPSSYNDVTQKKEYRDHVGWAWYDRTFRVPPHWENQRVFLRVGSAHYTSIVYVNGEKIVEHAGGYLPFLAEFQPTQLNWQRENRITIAINNTLTVDTVPQGQVVWQSAARYPEGYFTLNYNFDFFNYAGIHRSIFLYSTPSSYVDDIDVITNVDGTTGLVNYAIKVVEMTPKAPEANEVEITAELQDKEGNVVGTGIGATDVITVANAKLWWPFTMVKNDSDAGYLYTLVVKSFDSTTNQRDVYRLKVGIRTVSWTSTKFLINGKPFYFRGYGRHEDSDFRGKGFDEVVNVKDHNLIKWTGANSYRTSHYPYAEEIMDLADRLGIVVIDEVPAVATHTFGPQLMANHKAALRDLVQRDKNRPSVAMWCVANEPTSEHEPADAYFKNIIEYTRGLDPSMRPITLVTFRLFDNDRAVQYADIISINRYYAWYNDTGHTETIRESMIQDVENWARTHNKPVLLSEYGADTIPGLHQDPDFVFTEEYQMTLMKEHFKAFDYLRVNSALIGEHIWNFADFMTTQGIIRVLGNRKGIFTRERQPKASAHLLRYRFHLLAAEADQYPVPQELVDNVPVYKPIDTKRIEL